ncbi:MAG: hypothetical protein JKY97_11375 [Citromicrobium sp.]|nr:hypothetical protein [Citromicrobium sp.]
MDSSPLALSTSAASLSVMVTLPLASTTWEPPPPQDRVAPSGRPVRVISPIRSEVALLPGSVPSSVMIGASSPSATGVSSGVLMFSSSTDSVGASATGATLIVTAVDAVAPSSVVSKTKSSVPLKCGAGT